MTQQTDHLDARRATRRRLVSGAFASPAVLALHSGSAFAMASNLRCINSQLRAPILSQALASPGAYVKVELVSATTGTSNATKFYLLGRDVQTFANFARIPNASLRPGEAQEFKFDNANSTSGRLFKEVLPESSLSGITGSGKFVLIRVDGSVSSGVSIVGVVESSSTTGSAVSLVCWSSFAGAAL